jgi:adenosylcobinamide kinase/adenosylcobinamide-phosphate guanylyltransferase
MKGRLTLLLGGARSGKSRTAEKMAKSLGERVLYVATAEAKDEEMRARIEAHRSKRPATWRTIEVASSVGSAVQRALVESEADVVLLDCLTMLLSNVILEGLPNAEVEKLDVTAARARVSAEVDALLTSFRSCDVPWIIVSNEVGCGVVPATDLGRSYRDLLGWANQRMAEAADSVYLMVAGLPVNVSQLCHGEPDYLV